MSFPLYLLLFIYFLFLILWSFFSLVALYHMLKFGFKNFTTFFTTFIYLVISVLILMISYNYLSQIDWGINVYVLENMFNAKMPF